MVSFVKRRLAEGEIKASDLEELGIEESRRPISNAWEWAVDEKNDLYFTQLISTSGAYGEMKEGRYFYLLLIEHEAILIALTGRSVKLENNTFIDEAQFLDFGAIRKYPLVQLIETVNIAARVFCYDQKPFAFKNDMPISRYPLANYGGFSLR